MAPRQFENKAALVTGGASGIGRAVMDAMCGKGASVTFGDMSDTGAVVEKELRDAGNEAQFVQGDLAEEGFCHELADAAIRKWGKVDFLVNNAFSFIAKGADATREDWVRMMAVGPIGYATMSQCVLESMKQAGGGAIVNISSISAHIAQPGRWTYNVAKGRSISLPAAWRWTWRPSTFASTPSARDGSGRRR